MAQNSVTFSDTNCYRYLLGQMADDEIFDFEEICFADDALSEQLEGVREELIDRYLQKDLTAEDKKDFENYFLASPYHRKKLEFSKSLSENFAAKKDRQTAFTKLFNFRNFGKGFSLNNFSAARLSAVFGFVLIVGFGLLASWLSKSSEIAHVPNNRQNNQPNLNRNIIVLPKNETNIPINSNENTNKNVNKINQTPTVTPTNKTPETNREDNEPRPVIITFLPFSSLRGNGDEKPLVISKQTSAVRFQIDAPTDKTKKYFVSIKTADGAEVWKSALNDGGNSKKLFLTIPAKVFFDNDYKLEVFESGNTRESVDAYSFRVERKN